MNGREAISKALDIGDMVVQAYLGDLDDREIMKRPGANANHLAWQLGHLISSGNDMLVDVAPTFAVTLPAGFTEQHAKTQAENDNAKDFHSKTTYLELLGKVNSAAKAALAAIDDAALDQPAPEKWRAWFPTVGQIYILIATHPLMHAGQWAVLRRSLGKPIVM
jgi:hypothetical protein